MKPRIIEFGELCDTLALEVDSTQSDIYALIHSGNIVTNLFRCMAVVAFIHCVELEYFDIPDDVSFAEARTLGLSKEFDPYEMTAISNDFIHDDCHDEKLADLLTEVIYKLCIVIGGPNCYD